MGGSANQTDSSSLPDRINSWAKTSASGRPEVTSSGSRNNDPTVTPSALQHPNPLDPGNTRVSTTSNRPTATATTTFAHGLSTDTEYTTTQKKRFLPAKSNVNAVNSSTSPTRDEEKGEGAPTITSDAEKPTLGRRLRSSAGRFFQHTKDAIFHSWINVLLVFVPVGIAVNWIPIAGNSKATIVFAMNAVAIIPLAGLLSHATESVASRMGDTWASLLNVTFGNAVELIIFIIALAKNQISIVQASILGSILANLLLILGMAFTLGGLRFREQLYNNTVTQMSACLLSLSVMSLLLPTAFHASFSDATTADERTVKISRGTSVVLLLVYILYLLFQLKSHAYMYESTPQKIIDEESRPGVLADVLNSSSSSESSTSSSDSEGGSNRAKRRLKRAFHRRTHRKSSGSSTHGSSVPHPPVFEDESEDDTLNKPKITGDAIPIKTEQKHSTGTLSGDEADIDDEHKATMTRSRGLTAASSHTDGNLPSSENSLEGQEKINKKKKKHHLFGRHKKESKSNDKEVASEHVTNVARVDFSEEPQVVDIPPTNDSTTASPRRHFTRQISKPIGSLSSNLLSKTVFGNHPPRQSNGSFQPGMFPMSRASSYHPALRRTSSMPDRFPNRQSLPTSTSNDVSQARGVLVVNEPDAIAKATELGEAPAMSRTAAVVLLLCSTALVAFCAELLVDAIPQMIENTTVSQAFIGLIILPIVGNAAEHVTAVTVAAKNKMDLAIGVAVGSSIQIALFVTPFVVLLGWIMEKNMSLYFNLFETVSLFITTFIINFLILDGRSNYLEGSLLMAAYVIIAVAAFYYPNAADESLLGGGTRNSTAEALFKML